ncbi:NAD-dependent protein deacetylase HST1 [Phoenix dactylifera]|uniref:NAD-dependent protein deacetylase HST1 n=1 Tax=Phoenix dactylifera TaxID=42345 RepID=A0A8B9A7B9_PHODC|nr:NAD-dependent protein deacetylase HST1 [Phoenix dactylifera]
MIKRRCYKQDHGDRDASSTSSSSSSDDASDFTPEVEEEEEEDEVEEQEEKEEEGEEIGGAKEDEEPLSPSFGSGYESEDSSGNEVDGDSSGLLSNEEKGPERGYESPKDGQLNNEVDVEKNENANTGSSAFDSNDPIQADLRSCILKCKSVFKCRLCPRIVCLNEETVKQHLKSKRHARSKKLLGEGRLRLMLNSDGEIEEEQETHAERHARTVALAQELIAPKRKDTGRQRQNCRRKKRLHYRSEKAKPEQLAENPTKRKRKLED